jgi:hypothetical protein
VAETKLEQFLVERFAEFDPSISTVAGSRAQRTVIQPTVDRFGDDPFAVDMRQFIIDRIRKEFPTIDVSLTSVDDLLIKPITTILEPLRREIQAIRIQQSLEDPALLLEEEADALVANLLVSRIQGDRARGVARLFFGAAVDFVALPSIVIRTASGIIFHPTQVQSISFTEMQSNVEDNFFFFDINVEAEDEGSAGQIEPGELTRIDEAPGVVKITNKARFSGGVDRQTNEELKTFAEESVTERSLTTSRGVISQLLDNFPLEDVQPIGFGDPEMDRDIIESLGVVLESNTLAATASLSSGTLTDSAKTFDATPTPDVRVGDLVTFFTGPNTGKSFPVTTVGTTTLVLSGSPTDDAGPITYTVTQQTVGTLTISTIPGGVLSDTPLTVTNSEVHIGNHTDAYVKPPTLDQDSVDLLSLPSPDDTTVEGDKDLLDPTHIDVDLISAVKLQGIAVVPDGGNTMSVTDPLRRFGLVKNDVIRFLSPDALVAAGDLRIDVIVDGATTVLTLVDPDPTAPPPVLTGATGAEYQLLTTGGAIQPAQKPLVRVTTIDLMNSDTPPQPIAGSTIPFRDPVDIRSTPFFSPGATVSVGKFRVYFLEPTTVQFDSGDTGATLGTVFKVEDSGNTLYYRPDPAVILGDLGAGVRKVVNPDDGGATPIDSGASNGEFSAADTFELTSGTFAVDIDLGDLLIISNATTGLVTGNFYVTTGVSSGGTTIKVTPDFTGTIPTSSLNWEIIKQEDITSQRISAQDMAKNQEGSLFFVDIAAESYDFNTTGAAPTDPPSGRSLPADEVDDVFNIVDKTLATLEVGLRSLGYFFKQNTNPGHTRDETLAFSIFERLILSFEDRFMLTTVSDFVQGSVSPSTNPGVPAAFLAIGTLNNNTQGLEARNVRVNFETAPVVQDAQTFVDSGTGRVITENIVVKHMVPAFVDLEILYSGGLPETTIEPLLAELIDDTPSSENLSASDIDFLFRERGEAEDVTMPLGLVAIVHNQDRTISVERSEDALVVGRISHFFPGKLTLSRL